MSEIRRKALRQRTEIGLALDQPHTAQSVVEACLAATGLTRHFLPPGDELLAGAQAVLDLPMDAIYQDDSLPIPRQQSDAVHECAHVWLHRGTCHCAAPDLNSDETCEAVAGPVSKVDGYSPRQRRENEANLFAAELLLPGPLARRLFLDDGLSSDTIATQLGLPAALVQRQLADSILLPPLTDAPPKEETPAAQPVALDPSQQDAAEIASGPLLLGAGPGTGKTKTLVGRCRYLTQTQGVPAEKILALTFSRQAAQEMRERLVQAGVGTQDAGPWVGTFHSFGLDILRRFGDRLGLTTEVKLLDTLDIVTLLENHLPRLELDALDNLYNPAIHLGGIARQISRAKDELCPPERYAELCREMQAQAERAAQEIASRSGHVLQRDKDAVAKSVLQAAKATEVARCYAVYETLMQEQGFLDFADLIARTVALLEAHPDVLAMLQSEYPHVLADEYQDVNRACARLVRLLAGDDARGLWAVGDHRQSIYRFRGASPANVAAFGQDYPNGARRELGVNYRSHQPIVDLFAAAAQEMDGGSSWHAYRGTEECPPCPAVTLAVAPNEEGQADGIAGRMEQLRATGRTYRDMAILCRTHGQAEALANMLSARNIPVLYSGGLLERPEVKDLLCLLSLFADKDGSGLLRVAAWPEYAVPQAETLAVLGEIQTMKTPLLDALQEPGLPDGLRRLGAHLAELETLENDPAALLRHYLFGQSQFLRHLTDGEPKPFLRMQRLMAIHHLLGLSSDFDRRIVAPQGKAGNKVRDFLTHLRRLTAAGESLRPPLPPEAEALDAVRIQTVHAAKGLEYPIVFLPYLGAGQFPARGRQDGLAEPPGLTPLAGQETDEDACLFFVALSRARDVLVISRYETSATDRAVKPSPLLELLQPWFIAQGVAETVWPAGRTAALTENALPALPETLPTYSLSALETYGRCPRQYYYQHELKIRGTFTLGGYPQFHGCVHLALHWLEDERAAGRAPEEEEIAAKLEEIWAEGGPVGHLHEDKYKVSAHHMLRTAAGMAAEEERLNTKTLRVTLVHCQVQMRPDVVRLSKADGALIVARQLTGKRGADDHTDRRLALFRRAAGETHPDRQIRLQIRYLADGGMLPIEPPTTNQQFKWEADRVAKYDNAGRGISLRQFAARPSDECQSCGYTLICPV